MILNYEQTKKLINGDLSYDGRFAKHCFAYDFFQSDISPLGSIICFEYPTHLGKFKLQNAINLCIELPGYNALSTICFERLYLTQIGSLVSNALHIDCFVAENALFVDDKQLCVTLIKTFSSGTLLHVTIPTKTKHKQFSKLDSIELATKTQLMEDAVNSFHFLTKSIFIESQHNTI